MADPANGRDRSRGFRLLAAACDQCLVTRNRIVSARRAAEIIRQTIRKDCHFICHKAQIAGFEAACRGHFDRTGGGQLARIAGRLGVIIEVDPITLQDIPKEPDHG